MHLVPIKSLINTLVLAICFITVSLTVKAQTIDRFALVNRHNVILNETDPLAPLSVGNGDFAYTADVTGMQSLEQYYYDNGIPLETLGTFAWHSFPKTGNLELENAMKASDFHGRKIMYASMEKGDAGQYFRKSTSRAPRTNQHGPGIRYVFIRPGNQSGESKTRFVAGLVIQ